MLKIKFKEKRIKSIIIRFSFIVFPIFAIALYTILTQLLFKSPFPVNYSAVNSLVNISGVFAGFLLTASTIMYSLPENKFTNALVKSGYFNRVILTMFAGTIIFLITTFIGLFTTKALPVITILFIIGFSETILSAYYLFRIIQLSSKSK